MLVLLLVVVLLSRLVVVKGVQVEVVPLTGFQIQSVVNLKQLQVLR